MGAAASLASWDVLRHGTQCRQLIGQTRWM